MGRKRLGIITWIVIALAFTIYAVAFWRIEPKIENDSKMPPAPSEPVSDGYWLWDSNEREWVPKYINHDRAIAPKSKSMSEKDMQEYMEKKIPGYLEDTYWGGEYDLIDKSEE